MSNRRLVAGYGQRFNKKYTDELMMWRISKFITHNKVMLGHSTSESV